MGKWRAFVKATVAVLRRSPFLRVRVRVAVNEFVRTTPFVFVGNNNYNIDGFGIGGRESIDRGELRFWLARRTRPLGLLRLGLSRIHAVDWRQTPILNGDPPAWIRLRALFGFLRGARDFEAFCGTEIEVTPLRGKIRVAVDGETSVMDTPLHYRSRPRALRVMVPAIEKSA